MSAIKKNILLLGFTFCSLLLMSADWKTDFKKAKEEAKTTHKYILLTFTGSDWCPPCIKTKKEIFSKEVFTKFADEHLVLVDADFPRLKRNRLSRDQVKKNEELAEQYNKEGVFPFTLLLDANGKVLKEWRGFPGVSAEAFVSQIKEHEHSK